MTGSKTNFQNIGSSDIYPGVVEIFIFLRETIVSRWTKEPRNPSWQPSF
jgi:hypothetical protein